MITFTQYLIVFVNLKFLNTSKLHKIITTNKDFFCVI